VFFESPRRLGAMLADMADVLGGERRASVAREIGKTHEEIIHASLAELASRFAENPALGEVTVVVAGASRDSAARGQQNDSPAMIPATIGILCEAGLSLKQASAVLARLSGRSRREIYQEALASRRSDGSDG
jgi:16S rRNA (cytidine1402-2'-O)-methyltransferase